MRVSGGKAKSRDADEKREYLYQGIASRGFDRRFQLADYVRVASATLENGLLHVDLVREIPEAMKPRRIAIHAPEKAEKPALEGNSESV